MEISGDNYKVSYEGSAGTVTFEGIFRLGGSQDYVPIEGLLEKSLGEAPCVTLDFRKLEFANSSAINMIYKFVVAARKRPGTKLVALGSNSVPWQSKSLLNIKKFHPAAELLFEA